jgi:hypothetical protein
LGYTLEATESALADLKQYQKANPRKAKKIKKQLGLLETQGPGYPSLGSKKMVGQTSADGCQIWQSDVERNTPAAGRIYWSYAQDDESTKIIRIHRIIDHP